MDIDDLYDEIAEDDALEDFLIAAHALRRDANRLCDRCLGGSYEYDCRATIAQYDEAEKRYAIASGRY